MIGMRKKDDRITQLRSIELFDACPERELTTIAGLVYETTVPEGRVLCKEGDFGREAFVIVDGQAEVSKGGAILAKLGPGDVCGEMALLDGDRRSATVTALTPMTVLVISVREFESLLHSAPVAVRGILTELSGRLREADGVPATTEN
jgi:CRP/FNR family transcriptional regulator, cyclic AMP receptor protein